MRESFWGRDGDCTVSSAPWTSLQRSWPDHRHGQRPHSLRGVTRTELLIQQNLFQEISQTLSFSLTTLDGLRDGGGRNSSPEIAYSGDGFVSPTIVPQPGFALAASPTTLLPAQKLSWVQKKWDNGTRTLDVTGLTTSLLGITVFIKQVLTQNSYSIYQQTISCQLQAAIL